MKHAADSADSKNATDTANAADRKNGSIVIFGGAERTRTVIVFLDREVHTPFCHGPRKANIEYRISNLEFEILYSLFDISGLGGSAGFEPATTSFTVKSSTN